MQTTNPLLLTLNIDTDAQQFFNDLRKQYFPADRNFLDAHLMLFHQLPPHEPKIMEDIETIVQKHQNISLQVSGLSSIGNGVAYKIESGPLQQLHKQLQVLWAQWLIPQDKNKLWPHITIQNKVKPDAAKALLNHLSAGFIPFAMQGTGLSLWEYQGGPWQFVQEFNFTGAANQI
ncbi:2'-5' RNA ligase family protein [Mucilaginibacter phyllosphaerae]|nr:2'-5' RNA ligase family protein [Mucilaginibacter phyllosphaerae]MBB3969122.1 2'-5' RNA ligase [Mucilaginibacter phyllosphaerae]